jgi:hypothetical protein
VKRKLTLDPDIDEAGDEEAVLEWYARRAKRGKKYTLIGPDGQSYQFNHKGRFGGHRKLKIYGRLDCPSALRFIAKGQYVQHRVFFFLESDAIQAGYRPCAKCMPEAYRRWKNGNALL